MKDFRELIGTVTVVMLILMTIIMCGSVPNAVIRIVFPLMIFMNQKKTLETITNNLRERKDD